MAVLLSGREAYAFLIVNFGILADGDIVSQVLSLLTCVSFHLIGGS